MRHVRQAWKYAFYYFFPSDICSKFAVPKGKNNSLEGTFFDKFTYDIDSDFANHFCFSY